MRSAANSKHCVTARALAGGSLVLAVAAGGWLLPAAARAADKPKDFAIGLQFLFPPPKNYHNVSLYIFEKETARAKSSSYRKAQPWACRKEDRGWLIYASIRPDDEIGPGEVPPRIKRGYLAYRTSPPAKADDQPDDPNAPLVIISKTLEPHCYWQFENEDIPDRTSLRFHAKATTGDFKGWYLNLGNEVEEKVWSVTLTRDKPKSVNYMWLEGP
jgi:hypothetical protein